MTNFEMKVQRCLLIVVLMCVLIIVALLLGYFDPHVVASGGRA